MAGPVKFGVLKIIVAVEMELRVMGLRLLGFLLLLLNQIIQCENLVMMTHLFLTFAFQCSVSRFSVFVHVWNFSFWWLEVCGEGLRAHVVCRFTRAARFLQGR